MMNRLIIRIVLSIFLYLFGVPMSFGNNLWFDIETGAVFTGYNDVQIPSDTGTRFSLKNDIKSDTEIFYRVQLGYDLNDRHSIFALAAPLRVEGQGKLQKPISFAGVNFNTGTDIKTKFRFDSYRITYLYKFYNTQELKLGAGLTAKIRDAEITLEDNLGNRGTKSNTGFVPLIHLKVEWFFAQQFSLLFDGDGLAAPQGRAEDFILALNYYVAKDFSVKLGYRLLEGGSDGGGQVYTFSMFHYLSLGATYRF